MSRESRAQWAVIAGTAAVAGLLMRRYQLSVPLADTLPLLLTAIVLGGVAAYYRYRGTDNFVLCLTCLLSLTTYTAYYTLLMYSIGAIGAPWIDARLVVADEAVGFHLPSVVAWAQAHPNVNRVLGWAYNSLLLQTPITVVLLGFAGHRRLLNGFVREFMIASLICAAFFAVVPAEGPFAAYALSPSESQARYLQHLHQLRDGTRTIVTWNGAEGLITFPSFHTTWAILLAWSMRGRRSLFVASVLLNAAVIAGTMTTGWHYFSDVAAGAATATIAIALSAQWVARETGSSVAATLTFEPAPVA